MRRVTREEVRSREEYEKTREAFRRSVLEQKDRRRIHVGEHLTFLFENHDTVLYQIQEMIRAEGIHGEAEIRHEMDTYNELLGDKGELGCVLLVEIPDPAKRPELLARWKGLPETLFIGTRSGDRVPAVFDTRQVGGDRISSVQYLKFRLGDRVPVTIGCSHPDIATETTLSPEQAATLCGDLL
ncbi:MAG TPA: DUF3501 family protein [Terriglobia bacterium]|nr:DUF3501 family protein [Terriglobia bacterium]